MVDNLPFTRAHGSAAFVFRHVLQEPLKRVRKVQLVSMTMDYRLFAVNVAIDELGGTEFPVFVDKSFDAPLLLAPHVTYEHRFRGEPLGVLGCLTIAIRGYDGSELEQQPPQKSRVTMLFSVEHDCVDGADALDDSDMRRTWLMLSNKHTSDHQPYVFKWPGPSNGPIHNVKRVALKALVMSTHATEQPYVRLTIPELQISEWPVPYTCDIIGTYYPYVVMHRSADYQVDYWPPKCRLGSLTVDIAQGNGLPLAWEQVEDRLVFMLLEVDYQPSPSHLPAPRPLTSRLLFVDNYRAQQQQQQPFKFRFELDEPCRAVQQLQLHQLACPHVEAAAAVAFVRLSIHNLSISWIVPYATWFYKPQPNVPAANPALHSATFSQPAAFTHMDVELEWLDPATGQFRAFQALPEACQTMNGKKASKLTTTNIEEQAAAAAAEPLPLPSLSPVLLGIADDDVSCFETAAFQEEPCSEDDAAAAAEEEESCSEDDADAASEELCSEDDDDEDSALVCSLYELLCDENGTNVTEAVLALKDSLDTQNKVLYALTKLLEKRLTSHA
ncbi:hypothetical protein OEZ85_011043 [Tetradesmus obliquus]|uniref:Uncharacterized protein n=1 Tax=Tetradesmus obliquus TaxID=3088 RepID=A0ABY8TR92_TETOB|nr:hypothetical protein OEZ85_011043 [Tetradesmus obliquus]